MRLYAASYSPSSFHSVSTPRSLPVPSCWGHTHTPRSSQVVPQRFLRGSPLGFGLGWRRARLVAASASLVHRHLHRHGPCVCLMLPPHSPPTPLQETLKTRIEIVFVREANHTIGNQLFSLSFFLSFWKTSKCQWTERF